MIGLGLCVDQIFGHGDIAACKAKKIPDADHRGVEFVQPRGNRRETIKKGGDRIRTGESGLCRPVPYHLATPPNRWTD